ATRQETPAPADEAVRMDPHSLAQAFESFTHVAGSLENSYGMLQAEIAKLRRELESKNRDLARSLAENQQMRSYLAGILEVLPCGVLAVDSNFRLRFANPEAQTLAALELCAGAPSGQRLSETLRELLKEVAAEPPGAERNWVEQTAEGPRFVAVSCAVQPQGASGHGESVFILRDITQRKRLEEEREFARRMQALAEMTAVLAHEIRNPLGSLELFAGLIKEATPDHPEVSQWIVHVQAGLRALSATVNNVLHFHSTVPPQLAPLNIVRLLRDTVEFLQPLALQRGMGIQFDPAEREILIPADAHRLQQVFFNLAINAFRAMAPGKRLKIQSRVVRQDGHRRAQVVFQDEGVGIPANVLENIFDAGFTTVKSSPGLGLAVSKRVMAQHKGSIEVVSELGKGTTFSLCFPVFGGAV
ncbi:MAG TPA: ATP-binding protein, partial [Terriglobia bacterium]|nr:ATP-binding protein [Terriglobia bacterium]